MFEALRTQRDCVPWILAGHAVRSNNNPTLGITSGSRVALDAEQQSLLHDAHSKPGYLFGTLKRLRKCNKMCSSPGFHNCLKLDVLCRPISAREIPGEIPGENHFCQNSDEPSLLFLFRAAAIPAEKPWKHQ